MTVADRLVSLLILPLHTHSQSRLIPLSPRTIADKDGQRVQCVFILSNELNSTRTRRSCGKTRMDGETTRAWIQCLVSQDEHVKRKKVVEPLYVVNLRFQYPNQQTMEKCRDSLRPQVCVCLEPDTPENIC